MENIIFNIPSESNAVQVEINKIKKASANMTFTSLILFLLVIHVPIIETIMLTSRATLKYLDKACEYV